jgi:hypothetical protein
MNDNQAHIEFPDQNPEIKIHSVQSDKDIEQISLHYFNQKYKILKIEQLRYNKYIFYLTKS